MVYKMKRKLALSTLSILAILFLSIGTIPSAYASDMGDICRITSFGDNGNDIVDFNDYLGFARLWGERDLRSDFDGNEIIDFADTIKVARLYGRFSGEKCIREPVFTSMTITINGKEETQDIRTVTSTILNVKERDNIKIKVSAEGGEAFMIKAVAPTAKQEGATVSGNLFEWTLPYASARDYFVDFIAENNKGIPKQDRIAVTLNVEDKPNNPPVITADEQITVKEGERKSFTAAISEPDGEALGDVTVAAPSWAAYNIPPDKSAITFTLNPKEGDASTHNIVITAKDEFGAVSSKTIKVTVEKTNRAPVFNSIPDQRTLEFNELRVNIFNYVYDEENDAIEYKLLDFKKNGSNVQILNALRSDGVFIWMPSLTQEGEYTATVQVTDGKAAGHEKQQTFKITVNNNNVPPRFTSIAGRQVYEDTVYNFELSETQALTPIPVAAEDSDGQQVTITAEQLPQGAAFSNDVLSWTPNYFQAGEYTPIFKVSDGESTTEKGITIKVNNVNRAPRLKGITRIVANKLIVNSKEEDLNNINNQGMTVIGIFANDENPMELEVIEGQPLGFELVVEDPDGQEPYILETMQKLPQGASINRASFSENGKFTWTPDYTQGDFGKKEYVITFMITQGEFSAQGTVKVRVIDTNHAPVITEDERYPRPLVGSQFNYRTSRLGFEWQASDPDKDSLVYDFYLYKEDEQPKKILQNWHETQPSFFEFVSVGKYKWHIVARDSQGFETKSNVWDFEVISNRVPYANTASAEINEDAAKQITLTGSDIDGDSLTFSIISQPVNGVLSGLNPATGAVTYTPNANFNGADRLTFNVNDGSLDSSPVTMSIAVNPVDDPAVWQALLNKNVNEDSPDNTVAYSNLKSLCADADSAVNMQVTSTHAHYALAFSGNDLAISNMESNYNGAETVALSCNGISSSFQLAVNNVNDVPTANSQSVTTNEDTAKEITLSGSDIDGDALIYSIAANPAHGTLTGTGNIVTYTSAVNYNGADSFTFKVNDGSADSNTATVSITINPVNDAPAITSTTVTTALEGSAYSYDVEASDADGDSLAFSLTKNPTEMSINPNTGLISWTPSFTQSGNHDVVVSVIDSHQATVTQPFTINAANVNIPPVLAAIGSKSVNENQLLQFSLSATDFDNDVVTYSASNLPSGAAVSGDIFTWTPSSTQSASYIIRFTATDSNGGVDFEDVAITVANVNVAPTANSQSATTNEDSSVIITLAGSDVEGDALTFAIESNPINGALSGLNPSTGAVTYTPNANFNGADSFTFKANDGSADSNTATVSITVNPVNDVPAANSQSMTTDEDAAKSITLTGSDVDGSALTFSIVSNPANGALSGLNPATGAVTYTPNANFAGSDSFTFKVNDGSADSNTATVGITVNPVNDAPAANDDSVATNEDASIWIDVLSNDNDIEDNKPVIDAIAVQPTKGAAAIESGKIRYAPNANFNGADSFTYTVKDSQGAIDNAVVSVTINPVNDAPTANAQSMTTDEDAAKSITLTGSDVDGSALTFSIVLNPSNGALSGLNPATGAVTYTPNANFNGADSFTFKANDGSADSNTATVSITVNPVNDVPAANAQSVSTNEDNAKAITLTASDVDGSALTFSIVSNPANGALSGLNPATGAVTYTPNANFNGADSFTFKANDGSADSNTATVSITVNPVNDVPAANAQSVSTNEDNAKAITLTASDVDGSALTFSIVSNPANGALSGLNPATGAVTYTPNANYNGADRFTFKANDGSADSNTATVSVNVNAVNDAPALPAINSQAVNENELLQFIITAAADADGDALSYSASLSPTGNLPTGASFDGNTRTFTWIPSFTQAGNYNIRFAVSDNNGGSDFKDAQITVNNVNRAPAITSTPATTATENSAYSYDVKASDADGDSLTFSLATSPTGMSINPNTGLISWTPSFAQSGSHSVVVQVSDGAATPTQSFTIDVANVNGPPALDAIGSKSVNENQLLQFTISATEPDGEAITYSISNKPATANFDAATRTFTWTPAFNEAGTYANIRFTATDPNGASDSEDITITVVNVNRVPIVNAVSTTTNEDSSVTITLAGSDADSEQLTFSKLSDPSNGVLGAIASTGANSASVTYTPNANFAGSDSFTFKVNDGSDDSNNGAVSITVASINDVPAANSQSVATDEDTAKAITLTGSDVEGSALTFSIVSAPSNGALSGFNPATGAVTYTPNANFNGADSFTFKVNDGSADSNTATVSIGVGSVNDPPTLHSGVTPLTGNRNAEFTYDVTYTDVDNDPPAFVKVYIDNQPYTMSPSNPSDTNYTDGALFIYKIKIAAVGSHNFYFQASDGIATATSTTYSGPTVTNDAPTANAQSVSINEDAAKPVALTGSDSDSGDTITFSIVSNPSNGALSGLNPSTGAVTYTPNANYNGADSFTFKVNDGLVDSSAATVSITINPVNDAPAITSTPITTASENSAYSYDVDASDVEGEALTFSLTTKPTGMNIDSASGAITWTPDFAQSGSHSVVVQVSDSTAAATQSFAISVANVNRVPVADSQSITINEDVVSAITLAGSDADSNPLTFVIVSQPSNGALSGLNPSTGAVTYTPNANYNGADSFTFKVNDGSADSNTATVSVNVNAVNDVPTANAQSVSTNEDNAKLITLTGNDVEGSALTFSIVLNPSKGALAGFNPATGQVTYIPNANYNGADSFTFKANDGSQDSSAATVSISINAEGDAPVITTAAVTTALEGADYTYNVGATDADGDALTFSLTTKPTGMNIDSASGGITWTPGFIDSGSHSVVVQASDGAATAVQSFVIIVNEAGNQAPVLGSIGSKIITESQTLSFELSATDPDGTTSFTFSATGMPQGANLAGNTFIWTPAYTQSGSYTVTFFVSDGSAQDSETITITINDAGNQAPILNVASPQTVTEGQTLSFELSATDPDGTTSFTYGISNPPQGSTFDPSTRVFTWKPGFTQAGTYTTTFTVSDGSLTDSKAVIINVVEAGNQAPTISASDQTVEEGKLLAFTVSASDIDSAPPSLSQITVLNLPQGATFSNNEFRWTPLPTQGGVYEVSFRVDDGQLAVTRTIKITVKDILLDDGEKKDKISGKFVEIGSVQIPGGEDFLIPGEPQMMRMNIKNTANVPMEDIRMSASSSELDLDTRIGPFTIRPGQRLVKYLDFEVPEGAEPGEYYIRITIENSKFHRTKYAVVNVI